VHMPKTQVGWECIAVQLDRLGILPTRFAEVACVRGFRAEVEMLLRRDPRGVARDDRVHNGKAAYQYDGRQPATAAPRPIARSFELRRVAQLGKGLAADKTAQVVRE